MLKFLTILKVGMKAIARNKLRSTLTALGIIIGVAFTTTPWSTT